MASPINIVQTDEVTTEQTIKHKFTDIRVNLGDEHLETRIQIFEANERVTGTPIIDLRSGQNIATNGNVVSLSKTSFKIILKNNTEFKCRAKFRSYSGWASWTGFVSFRSRDLDYKYIRGNTDSIIQTARGAMVINSDGSSDGSAGGSSPSPDIVDTPRGAVVDNNGGGAAI